MGSDWLVGLTLELKCQLMEVPSSDWLGVSATAIRSDSDPDRLPRMVLADSPQGVLNSCPVIWVKCVVEVRDIDAFRPQFSQFIIGKQASTNPKRRVNFAKLSVAFEASTGYS